MYTREQASQLRQAFWTTFGHYMAPVLPAGELPVNWVNYKTGFKHLYFRLQADKRSASIAIELTHPDPEIQLLFFEQFEAHSAMLHEQLGEEWEWALHTTDENGKTISRIYKELSPVSIFNKENWPLLISFFKPRLISLDAFWTDAQYGFEELR